MLILFILCQTTPFLILIPLLVLFFLLYISLVTSGTVFPLLEKEPKRAGGFSSNLMFIIMAEDHRISNYSFVLVFNVHIPQFPFCLFSFGYFLVKGGSSPRASPSVLSSHSFTLCPFAVSAIIHIPRIYSCFISHLYTIYFFRFKSVFVQFPNQFSISSSIILQ